MVLVETVDMAGVDALQITSAADVCIERVESENLMFVEIIGHDRDNVKTSRFGSTLEVNYTGNDSGTVVISSSGSVFQNITTSGSTVISSSGRNISIVNGDVYINGKLVTENGTVSNEPPKEPVKIRIGIPDGFRSLNCKLEGIASLKASPKIKSAKLSIQGSSKAEIQAKDFKVNISGSGQVDSVILGGNLNANISGSGKLRSGGTFEDVAIDISGSGRSHTVGQVQGDYDANVSGMGSITHDGTIAGRKDKSISGMGSISI